MKVSIITVCYNSAKSIKNTFQSVQMQTYHDLEYIVVDGQSTDETLKIANRFKHIISKIISEPDKGLYDAMNKGIQMATGDIVGILNSDDVFYDEKVLQKVAEFHSQHDIDASIGNIIQCNFHGKQLRKYSSKFWKPQKLKLGFMPPHPAIFFKRELFEKYGNYSLYYKIGADYDLITRFFLKHHITWKYNYITTTKMLLGGVSSSRFKSYKIVSKEIAKALRENNIPYNPVIINFRFLWKLIGFLKRDK